MTLPANWSTVTVTGTYLNIDGEPLKGAVAFSTTTRVVDAAANVTVPPSVRRVSLDTDGKFSVVLPATDDPDVAPTGFTYRVDEDLVLPTGARSLTNYLIQLPAAAATVDLADVVPVTPVGEVSPYLRKVDVGTGAGTVAAGNDPRIVGAAQKAANLADLASAPTARTNLGLGNAATRVVGTAAGTVAAGDDPRLSDPNAYIAGVTTMRRRDAISSTVSGPSTGTTRLTWFTATRAETWNKIAVATGGTAAGATPTLCRMGVYLDDGSGNLTLVASCANDTSLFAAANTRYERNLTAPYVAVAGARYALGVVIVSAAAIPTFVGSMALSGVASILLTLPRLQAVVASPTDLQASISSGAFANSGNAIFGELLP